MVFDIGKFIFLVMPAIYGAGLIISPIIRNIKQLEHALVTMTTGIFVWITMIYALDLIDLNYLAWYGILTFVIIGLTKILLNIKSLLLGTKKNFKLIALISVSALVLAYPVLLNGVPSEEGMWFFGVNEHDGLWHAALMKTLLTDPLGQIPTFSGQSLQGYHVLLDLFGASVAQSFQISEIHIVFQLFPVLFSWLLIVAIYSVGLRLYSASRKAWIVVAFSLFGGNLGYIASLVTHKSLVWESMFWAQQGTSTMINLPFALSMLGVFTSILIFTETIKRRYVVDVLALSLMMGTFLLGVKVYAGILIITSYGLWSLYRLSIEKSIKNLCFRWVILILGIFYIFPSLSRAGSAFIVEPGWFIKSMMTSSDRVNVPQWEIARLRFSQNIMVTCLLWIGGIALFIIGNFGVKLFGIIGLGYKVIKANQKDVYIVLLSIVLAGMLLPLLLIQRGIAWNAIQFMYYSLFISCLGIPAFLQFLHLDKKPFIIVLLFIFSLPSTVQALHLTTQNYQQKNHARIINAYEIQALDVLSNLPNGVVLSPYDESAVVPAFSGKSTYFSDPTQAELLLLDYQERQTELHRVFIECMPEIQLKTLMNQNDLTYLYLPFQKYPDCVEEIEQYQQLIAIYKNEQVAIWEIH